jgi:hypothetical protein
MGIDPERQQPVNRKKSSKVSEVQNISKAKNNFGIHPGTFETGKLIYSFFYGGFFSVFFYAYASPFYDVFFFYQKA